jgi:sulfatase modifying factor 1
VDAQAFCKWLSQKTGKVFRLPTEAEWEYAARAGVAEAYLWGSDPQKGEGWANIWDVATQKRIRGEQTIFKFKDDYMYTSPVGSFKPNAFGLYDVIGNIMEWCSDYYGEYLDSPQTNPKGPLTGEKRIIRSSSWITSSRWDRLASRNSLNSPTHSTCGFRIVMNAEPARASEEEESGISLWWIWLLVAILIIGIVFMKYRSYQRKNMSKNHN